jgi:hypothetical protein
MKTAVIILALWTSAAEADQLQITWDNLVWQPNYDMIPPQWRPSVVVPVTLTGSIVWDSTEERIVAGLRDHLPGLATSLDPDYWSSTGTLSTSGFFHVFENCGITWCSLFGETTITAIDISFVALGAPLELGVYDDVSGNILHISTSCTSMEEGCRSVSRSHPSQVRSGSRPSRPSPSRPRGC